MEKPLIRNSYRINDVLTDLQARDFFYLFKLKDDCISCKDYSIAFEEFDILEVHRLVTSAEENYILYAIKCDKFNIKGVIINSFGFHTNNFLNKCMSKLLNDEQPKFKYHKADCVSEPQVKAQLLMCESLTNLLLMQHLS